MQERDTKARNRFLFFISVTGLFVLVLLWQYVSIMLVKAKPSATSTLAAPLVERGPILDRNGRVLALQTKLSSVTAWVPHVENPRETAEILGKILDMDPEQLNSYFTESSGFLYIKRKISTTAAEKIEEQIRAGKCRGISLEPEFGRSYPERNLACHLIGYVGTDNTGLAGLEYSYDHELSPGIEESEDEIVYGNQLFLTIDLNVQYFADIIAEKAYKENDADSVMLLVADAENGDILAYVSKPDFDPNSFAGYDRNSRMNRPIEFSYEPGSVFKIFSLSSLIDLGGITGKDTFYCGGAYTIEIPGEREDELIHDLRAHGRVNAQKIIQYSCNVGIASASETVSAEEFHGKLRDFGFGSPTGIPMAGETSGELRPVSRWSIRSKPTIAFGQEIGVSALQVVTAATALANGGIMLRPRVVKKILDPKGKVETRNTAESLGRVISPETAENMLEYMETATFPAGTARDLYIEGLRISAKTGTGEIIDKTTGKYSEKAFLASTIAIFPTEAPRFIVYAVLEYPKGEEYYGSRVAVPVVREVIEEMVPYFGIPRAGDIIVRHPGVIETTPPKELIIRDTMPDLTGLSKREILPLFEIDNVSITLRGEGWVISQKPAAGTPITPGMEITVTLE